MAVGGSKISIGQLKRSATLLKNTPVGTDSGTEQDSYAAVLMTRCSLEKTHGTFDLLQGALNREKTYKMICRYQAAIVIDTDSIWQIGNYTYRVEDFTLIDDINDYYEFILTRQGLTTDFTVDTFIPSILQNHIISQENNRPLVGTVNGINLVFTTEKDWLDPKYLEIYINGIRQTPVIHFTTSGTNMITFDEAPEVGDNLLSDYLSIV